MLCQLYYFCEVLFQATGGVLQVLQSTTIIVHFLSQSVAYKPSDLCQLATGDLCCPNRLGDDGAVQIPADEAVPTSGVGQEPSHVSEPR